LILDGHECGKLAEGPDFGLKLLLELLDASAAAALVHAVGMVEQVDLLVHSLLPAAHLAYRKRGVFADGKGGWCEQQLVGLLTEDLLSPPFRNGIQLFQLSRARLCWAFGDCSRTDNVTWLGSCFRGYLPKRLARKRNSGGLAECGFGLRFGFGHPEVDGLPGKSYRRDHLHELHGAAGLGRSWYRLWWVCGRLDVNWGGGPQLVQGLLSLVDFLKWWKVGIGRG
jgi:hypothetical protein